MPGPVDSEASADPSSTLILTGDYEYLGDGYYACLEAEARGDRVLPSIADALDAYVVPIALERVERAGLPVPRWYLTNSDFAPPAVLYGVNPFARHHLVVQPGDDVAAAARKVSRQGKFVVCCQELPADAALVEFEQVFDRCPDERYADWAAALYRLFRLPLSRVRLIVTPEQDSFSAVERQPREKLTEAGERLLLACLEERTYRRG